ncbi:MAG TPA: uridine phosphorylase [Bacillales bacterium]|nr:uridine phosphorylase [Bacillales bacterium]
MKLYGDFTREDWMKILKIEPRDIPASLIFHGEWDYQPSFRFWKETLADPFSIPSCNAVIGKYQNQGVGFANVFGGPMAAVIAHQFAVMGTEHLIQTGYFGGLSHDLQYGDILIVTGAQMEDGVSQWYLPDQQIVHSDPRLVETAIQYCEDQGYQYVTGTVFSTGAIAVETEEMVSGWAKEGHIGVDMETAATLSVAGRFHKKGIGLLNLSDHMIKGDHLFSKTEDRRKIMKETNRKIRDLALYLAT